MPPSPQTSGSWGRTRPWPWPGNYRPVPKNLGSHWCSMLCCMGTSEVYGSQMILSSNDIVETSLLKPVKEECGTSPIQEEEAILLGTETKLLQVPEISSVDPAKWIIAPRASSPSHTPWCNCHPSQRARESGRGIDADPNHPGRWVHLYLQGNDRVPEW